MVRRPNRRWIQSALRNHKQFALHRQLGIPIDEVIPLDILESAARAPGKLGQRARLALTLRRINAARRVDRVGATNLVAVVRKIKRR